MMENNDENMFQILYDMIENPDDYLELVRGGMIASLKVVESRILAIDSEIFDAHISEAEYHTHFKELFTEFAMDEQIVSMEKDFMNKGEITDEN